MSNEISNERLEQIASGKWDGVRGSELDAIANELLALRKAFSVPDYWEIAGQIFATEEEALSYAYRGKPEPLYSKPEA
ncbi:hypothetical protein RN053_21220 [Pantoea dispersa]|uniref:hypothetical protein n=1 Tax=Pantoea dispersa TaxID=59814 RepID=UPI0028DF0C9A|nr:hypothetical protein [Pantoea dispersa]MDT8853032.1 hypothetical protein [Pantoea dispersa]